ncbi:MAG: hypothetical protein HY811_01665 [Planctomycetes bacterium]|nr:hypothetical protein [Planctomycetota bacterium]
MKKTIFVIVLLMGTLCLLTDIWAEGTPIKIGNSDLSPGGYVHLRYSYTEEDTAADTPDTMENIRAHLFLDGKIATDVTGRVEYDFYNNTLLDARFTLSHIPYTDWAVTVGQFKIPFSFAADVAGTPLQETIRSPLIYEPLTPTPLATFSDRELGVMAQGLMLDKKASYAIAVFNGNGINTTDDSDLKDRMFQIRMLPWKDDNDSPLKPMEFGAAWITGYESDPNPLKIGVNQRDRYAYSIKYELSKIMITYEYFSQMLDVTGTDNINSKCWYLQLTTNQTIDFFGKNQVIRPIACYQYFDPDNNINNDEVRMTTFGFNWQMNRAVRFMLNYNDIREDIKNMDKETLIQMEVRF